MYKVTIEEVVGEVRKITTVETEDVELVKELLRIERVIEVDSDEANRNISQEWQELQKWLEEEQAKQRKPCTPPFGAPYESPGNPWTKPYDPYSPFVVTC